MKKVNYLDANNLYDWAMSQSLPYGSFEWLSQEEIKNFDVNSTEKNSSNRYLLKVILSILMNYMIFIIVIH